MSPNPEGILAVFFPLICSGFFLIPAVILLFFFFRVRMKSQASLRWPYVAGRILSTEVRTNTERIGEDSSRVRYTYSPVVQYEYTVNGQPYTAKRIHYGVTPHLERAKAERFAQHYVPGMPLKVYYNPEKPDEAVLEQKSVSSWSGLIFGLVFAGLSVCACLGALIGVIRMIQ